MVLMVGKLIEDDPDRVYQRDKMKEEEESKRLQNLEPFVISEGLEAGTAGFIPLSRFNLLYGIAIAILGLLTILSWLLYQDGDDRTAIITLTVLFLAYLIFLIYKNWETIYS
jgi:hypothetical protein